MVENHTGLFRNDRRTVNKPTDENTAGKAGGV